ncbi:MAG: hypothetical protein LBT36_05835, partial [Oscillospiraceae bacterium]|nr:hypothetical protein [Oscillospiraceae bacterium]
MRNEAVGSLISIRAAHEGGGSTAHFAFVKDVNRGDVITYTTSLGTRTYAVVSVTRIAETDWSQLQASSENKLT